MYLLNKKSKHILINHGLLERGALETMGKDNLLSALRSEHVSGKELHGVYAQNKGEEVDVLIAKHPNTLTPTLNGIVQRGGYKQLVAVAEHANTSKEALTVLGLSAEETVLVRVARHPNTPIKTLLSLLKAPYRVRMAIVSRAPMPDPLLVALLSANVSSQEYAELLMNPHIEASTLSQLIAHANVKQLRWLAQNPSVPLATLKTLLSHTDGDVLCALAKNPSLDEATLTRLARITKQGVQGAVAINPATPADILRELSRSSVDFVREMVALHANTTQAVLDTLMDDPNIRVRKGVAQNKNASLTALKRLANDSEQSISRQVALNRALGVVVELEQSSQLLKRNGYGCFDFYGIESPKKVTQHFIGSKHKEEVAFLFNAKHCATLEAISRLQSAFTNRKGKLDRDRYLQCLTKINTYVPHDQVIGLSVETGVLADVLTHFDSDLVVSIVMQYGIDEARDMMRMISAVVRLQNEIERDDELAQIQAWLLQNQQRSVSQCFHHFLTQKNLALFKFNDKREFWQSCLVPNLPSVKPLLPKAVTLNFPENTGELRKIGHEQRHCVGTQYYADRCIDGSNVIFQLAPKGNMKHGYTFQFSRNGMLLQAKGFTNSNVPSDMVGIAKKIFKQLNDPTALAHVA